MTSLSGQRVHESQKCGAVATASYTGNADSRWQLVSCHFVVCVVEALTEMRQWSAFFQHKYRVELLGCDLAYHGITTPSQEQSLAALQHRTR